TGRSAASCTSHTTDAAATEATVADEHNTREHNTDETAAGDDAESAGRADAGRHADTRDFAAHTATPGGSAAAARRGAATRQAAGTRPVRQPDRPRIRVGARRGVQGQEDPVLVCLRE